MLAEDEKQKLLAILDSLPAESRHEVLDFAEFLTQRRPTPGTSSSDTLAPYAGAWKGDPLVREHQGEYETHEDLS